MPLFIKGTDTELRGTDEIVPGTCRVIGLDGDGLEYDQTDLCWDASTPNLSPSGRTVWISKDGDFYEDIEVEERDEAGNVIGAFTDEGYTYAEALSVATQRLQECRNILLYQFNKGDERAGAYLQDIGRILNIMQRENGKAAA